MSIHEIIADEQRDRYFAATPVRPGTYPSLFSRRPTSKGYVDEVWRPRERIWTPTGRLGICFVGGAGNELESIDERRAQAYQDLVDRLWPEARQPRE